MSTLIQRPDSPFWFVVFNVPQPDGTVRRLKKSTKKMTEEEAMTVAPRIIETERQLAVATDEENRTNHEILAEANRAAAKGELGEEMARQFLSRILENATGKGLQNYTVRTWSEEWQRRKAPLAKATRDRYATSVRTFLAFLGEKADKRVELVTKADVRDFRDVVRYGRKLPKINTQEKVKGKPETLTPIRTAKTTNQYTADITNMFMEAITEDLLTANPTRGLKPLPEDDSITREPFTKEEVRTLIKKAGEPEWHRLVFSPKTTKPRLRLNRCEDWPGMILFGYYVGTRIGDIARLTWENINFERALATFIPSKTKQHMKSYQVPLHPRLVTWLQSRNSTMERRGPVFPTLYRTTPAGKVGLSLQFVAIMEYAKIDRVLLRSASKGIKAQYARGFHSLRHTSNSALANAGVSQEMRMKIIGHQSAEMNQIYTHLDLEKLRMAIRKLPTI